ncbi:MAG: type II 3-dehydroquinate dehydratase [Candidatus Omnitrophota bacterium]
MNKVLVIHGPNLNMLGTREIDVYGTATIAEIDTEVRKKGKALGLEAETFQSNHEGEIVDRIGEARKNGVSAIIINPAAYTHTSVAIRDAISGCGLPVIEVHLSNIYAREEFRHTSLVAPVAVGQISGFGMMSYVLALESVADIIKKRGSRG